MAGPAWLHPSALKRLLQSGRKAPALQVRCPKLTPDQGPYRIPLERAQGVEEFGCFLPAETDLDQENGFAPLGRIRLQLPCSVKFVENIAGKESGHVLQEAQGHRSR